MPKVTLTCHPEVKPKDLASEKEILPLRLRSRLKAFFAQNDSFAVTLVHFSYSQLIEEKDDRKK